MAQPSQYTTYEKWRATTDQYGNLYNTLQTEVAPYVFSRGGMAEAMH